MRTKAIAALMTLCLLISLLPTIAFAQEPGDTVTISTAEDLMTLLSTTAADAGATVGVTYTLDADLSIDTSALETSFSASNSARTFRGVLDGNGHTVTVTDSGTAPSQPLFDFLQGSYGQYAGVKNLTLVFEGDVAGTTVASCLTYSNLENLDIRFQKDIVFAPAGEYAIAAGVFGFQSSGSPISLRNISVTATGEAPYGTIGSYSPQNARYVLAAGIHTERNQTGELICEGINVNVRTIHALSNYIPENSSTYAVCCAAGVGAGYNQSLLRLKDAAVYVAEDIYAEAVEGSSADADAFGLGYHLLAMYHCSVTVGGNIQAKGNASGYKPSSKYKSDGTICASGMGYVVQTKYNDTVFGMPESGTCSVQVGGDILATVTGASVSPVSATACGIAVYTGQENTWRNVSVEADRIHAEADGTCMAAACGFAYNSIYSANKTGEPFDFENCSVTTAELSAQSALDSAYAAGFMFWGYGTYLDCAANVGNLTSLGAEAASAGFTYDFSPNTSTWRSDQHGELDGCQVDAGSITAQNTDPNYGAEVSGLIGTASLAVSVPLTATVRNCSVTIEDTLAATGYNCVKGLLVETNDERYEIYDNLVTLPRDQADVVTLDGVDYVCFTAMEHSGRAGETPAHTDDWESGNQVHLTGHSENDIFCRYDHGNQETGTLWQLIPSQLYYSLTYESNGGTQYDSETYSSGTTVTLDKTPSREGYDFTGWFADPALTVPVTQVLMDGSKTVYAGWAEQLPDYVLTYESNGGTRYDSETYSSGTTVTLDKTPSREGYSFTGWFADPALTSPVTQVVMDGSKTVYAGWSPNSAVSPPGDSGQSGSQGGQNPGQQSGTTATTTPHTGDNAHYWMALTLLVTALGGTATVVIRRRRNGTS